jgi:transposase
VGIEHDQDLEILRTKALLLDKAVQSLMTQNARLLTELNELKGESPEQLRLALAKANRQNELQRRKLFGASSEKNKKNKAKAERRARSKGHGPTQQPALPLDLVHHELAPEEQLCDSCGKELAEWTEQFEESEEIHVLAREYVIRRHLRKKYRCQCGACIKTAPGPKRLFEGARYSPEFAIDVAVAKYADHLPLDRQAKMMARDGLNVKSQTLWDQVNALATVLAPLKEPLHQYVLSHSVIGADETPWKLLGASSREDDGPGKNWYVWAVVAPTAASYILENGRSTESGKAALREYSGIVVCDGYSVYSAIEKRNPGLRVANCWAHVRRKYLECEELAPEPCGAVLELINQLFAIEAEIREQPPDEKLASRRARSKPIISRIHSWALATPAAPGTALRDAISYMGNRWAGLKLFLEEPLVELSNNSSERALRGWVLGRKTYFGSRSERGTEVAALLFSLMESSKLCGLDPRLYLRTATAAILAGESPPLPHELKNRLELAETPSSSPPN